jgi:hypothetical protein
MRHNNPNQGISNPSARNPRIVWTAAVLVVVGLSSLLFGRMVRHVRRVRRQRIGFKSGRWRYGNSFHGSGYPEI